MAWVTLWLYLLYPSDVFMQKGWKEIRAKLENEVLSPASLPSTETHHAKAFMLDLMNARGLSYYWKTFTCSNILGKAKRVCCCESDDNENSSEHATLAFERQWQWVSIGLECYSISVYAATGFFTAEKVKEWLSGFPFTWPANPDSPTYNITTEASTAQEEGVSELQSFQVICWIVFLLYTISGTAFLYFQCKKEDVPLVILVNDIHSCDKAMRRHSK